MTKLDVQELCVRAGAEEEKTQAVVEKGATVSVAITAHFQL